MKPNGFVAAASITSHGSTPIVRQATASSLASAMFTLRNVFSSSLAVSATRGLEASNTEPVIARYSTATNHLRDVCGGEPPVARVYSLRREGEEEVAADNPAAGFEPRKNDLFGGAGERRALEDHQLSLAQMRQQTLERSQD